MSFLSTIAKICALSLKAGKKTIGIVGDDLALNSKALLGLPPERELPIVYEVAKKSLINKVILIPAALALSALFPWAIVPLMTFGGAFLCYEGAEKLVHRALNPAARAHQPPDTEETTIKKAAQTDFILSAEIIVVALGSFAGASLMSQAAALTLIGLAMTGGVYGAVAGLVKMDDYGHYLSQQSGVFLGQVSKEKMGKILVAAAPKLLKTIAFLGTVAMFTVGGEIITHGLGNLSHVVRDLASGMAGQGLLAGAVEMGITGAIGLACGLAAIPALAAAKSPYLRAREYLKSCLSSREPDSDLTEFLNNLPQPETPNAAPPANTIDQKFTRAAKPSASTATPSPDRRMLYPAPALAM